MLEYVQDVENAKQCLGRKNVEYVFRKTLIYIECNIKKGGRNGFQRKIEKNKRFI